MSGPLGREQVIELFEELSSELARRGARAHVYVFAGAAMSVAFDRLRAVDVFVGGPNLQHEAPVDALAGTGPRGVAQRAADAIEHDARRLGQRRLVQRNVYLCRRPARRGDARRRRSIVVCPPQ